MATNDQLSPEDTFLLVAGPEYFWAHWGSLPGLTNAQDCSFHDDARSLQVYYSRSIIILAATQLHYESRVGTRRRIPQDRRELSLAEDSRGQ